MTEQQIEKQQQIREEELKAERFERRVRTTVWAAGKTVKWAIIGAAGAFVYSKIMDNNTKEVTEEI